MTVVIITEKRLHPLFGKSKDQAPRLCDGGRIDVFLRQLWGFFAFTISPSRISPPLCQTLNKRKRSTLCLTLPRVIIAPPTQNRRIQCEKLTLSK